MNQLGLKYATAVGFMRDLAGVDACESGAAGCADGGSAAVMFILRGDVADALVEPDFVVEDADAVEFGFELARVFDLVKVRELGLDVAEQALDPGLVVGCAG